MRILDKVPVHDQPAVLFVGTEAVTIKMTLDEGITIVPEGSIRLPLLGLRAIVQNRLRLVVDGKRRHVTLKTGWL